ncbi:MAG: aminotransferase class I/II-fold pyridoxal phosphate-dependent enzyme [Thermococci archaeon]|nr:aminotransferase class I/II-fold pyridoxal phosphate-dependent enzyme [Thermococci archaeon]
MTDKTKHLKEKLREMQERGEVWELRRLNGPTGPRAIVEGREMIVFASNNYLNLAGDPRLREAAIEAIKKYGWGAGSDWSIAGYTDLQDELHKKIAEFKKTEAGLAFQTGLTTNIGTIAKIVGRGDVVLSDELNHGSIIDGIRLSRADKVIYKHLDMGDLEDKLRQVHDKYEHILIVTDGVFSMDGDVAPMDEIVKLADEYGAMTYVDDAHGEGVLGGGRGIGVEFGVEDKIDFQMGTFSKALGSVGGMLAGDAETIEYVRNTARTWLLSAAYPPAVTAANIKSLEIVLSEPERVKRLWDNTKYFKKEMESMGYNTGNSQTPIVPAIVGDTKKVRELAHRLFEEGIFVLPIVFPMVPRGTERIRNQINADHTREDLDKVLEAYERIGKELGII